MAVWNLTLIIAIVRLSIAGRMDGRTKGWPDGWMAGQKDGRTDGWMAGRSSDSTDARTA